MKHAIILLALLVVALSACNKQPANTQGQGEATPAQAMEPAPDTAPSQTPSLAPTQDEKKPRQQITADEIAQIKASGKTGLWAEDTAVCAKDAKNGLRTTLTWNVEGADHVVIYAINNAGKEKRLGKGGPVGKVETGPWIRPGTSFKLMNADSNQELGKVEIGEKPC